MNKEEWIVQLNADTKQKRLDALKTLKTMIDNKEIAVPETLGFTNNHVHTTYSFSPYSPAKAVWMAYMSGLSTVGIVDHDAINGADEFIQAGEILGISTTVGFEVRTDWSRTRFAGKRINNPDQLTNAYVCAHGIPHTQIAKVNAYLSRVREAREKRNRAMTAKINDIMKSYDISISYDNDVLPLSMAADGGEVTERHILFALTNSLIEKYGKGKALIDMLEGSLSLALSESQKKQLSDTACDIYAYDLLNVLKGGFVERMYIDANTDEAPDIFGVVAFIKECGAIASYCYLGDVAESPTGDKKAQTFEDGYLDDLFEEIKRIGFDAIAYMPSRNTVAQLNRVMAKADTYGFMQISGEDINQPRQSFICRQLKDERFKHLVDTTWALVGHEKAATNNLKDGMFSDGADLTLKQLREHIEKYKQIGMD